MATVELTTENFNETLARDGITLVDFWASWCGPCRQFAPIYEKASTANGDIVFGKVDTEAQQELAAAFDIQSIPTLLVVRDRMVLYSQPGALPGDVLDDLIDQARKVDMADVRRQANLDAAATAEAAADQN